MNHAVSVRYAVPADGAAIGRGFGRVLFARAVDELVTLGYRDSLLWVAEANDRARHFYERAGWCADGAVKSDTTSGLSVVEVRYRNRIADSA